MRIWRVAPFLACLFLSAIPAKASDRLPVVGPTDFHFTFSEPAQFTARAYAIEHGIDSMLWLYDGAGNVVAANDDWFGLDSWLDVPLEAGVYRLRAGVCCGDPEAWYGESYEVELNSVPVEPTTTTVQETTTTSEPVVTDPPATDPPPTDPPVTEPETTTTSDAPTTTSEPAPTTTEPAPPPVIPPQPEEPIWIPPTPDTVPAPDSTEPAATEPSVSEPDSTEVPASTNVVTEDSASVPSVSETAPPAEPEPEPEPLPEPEPTPEPDTPTEPDAVEPDATLPPLVPETPSDATISAIVPPPPADAPEDEKRAFEEQVNIFAGGYDNYVPAGSTVTVAQRRTIVAATIAVSSILPGPAPSRRRK